MSHSDCHIVAWCLRLSIDDELSIGTPRVHRGPELGSFLGRANAAATPMATVLAWWPTTRARRPGRPPAPDTGPRRRLRADGRVAGLAQQPGEQPPGVGGAISVSASASADERWPATAPADRCGRCWRAEYSKSALALSTCSTGPLCADAELAALSTALSPERDSGASWEAGGVEPGLHAGHDIAVAISSSVAGWPG